MTLLAVNATLNTLQCTSTLLYARNREGLEPASTVYVDCYYALIVFSQMAWQPQANQLRAPEMASVKFQFPSFA